MKTITKKTDGTVVKTIIRTVVREEMSKSETRLEKKLDDKFDILMRNLIHDINSNIKTLFEYYFAKYRDETMIKLDKAIEKLEKNQEEQILHDGNYEKIENRIEKLETIHPQGQHI